MADMRAIRYLGDRRLELRHIPRPQPGTDEALVRVTTAGICQTDVHIVAGEFPVTPPRTLGHELAGDVLEVGPGGPSTWLGRSVGIQPATYCGTCPPCTSGLQGHCQRFRCLGNTDDGGWAECVVVAVDQLVALDGAASRRAVWLEPLSCIVHALGLADPQPGSSALVIGAGPMGLLAAQTARAMGSAIVVVVDPNAGKLALARTVGVDLCVEVEREGPTPLADEELRTIVPAGFQTIVDTTGRSTAVERAIRWASVRSTVVLFGVSRPDERLDGVMMASLFAREIALRGAAGSTLDAFDAARRLLAADLVQTDPLVWRVVELEGVPDMVGRLGRPGDKGKVLIDLAGSGST